MDNLVYNAVAPWRGYLHWVGNVRKGFGKNGNEYAFADFTLKYTDSKMQEKFITFSIGDVDKVGLLESLAIGTPLKVSWLPDTAEDPQKDRWYPRYSAYNVAVIDDIPAPAPKKAEKITAPNSPLPPKSSEAWKNPMTPKNEDTGYRIDDPNDLPFS